MTSLHMPLTIRDLLRDANLSQYESAFLKQGADDIQQLMELPDKDLRELLRLTGMESKPFHVMRVMKILGRSNKPSTPEETELTVYHGNTYDDPIGSSSAGSVQSLVNTHTVTVYATQIDAAEPIPSSEMPQYPSTSSTDTALLQSSAQLQEHHLKIHPSLDHHQQLPTSTSLTSTPSLNGADYSFHFVKSADELNSLLDDSVPIQKRLSPSLFNPEIWDSGRMEIIRDASRLYTTDTCEVSSGTVHELLGSFEQSMNEASYQLCLYDPTLLVRKDELFTLANKCVVRSLCKRKASDNGFSNGASSKKSRKSDRSSMNLVAVNRSADGKFTSSFELNYELREKEMQALDKLLSDNSVQQQTKQAQLVAAQQKKDYSTALKLQEEISSLGQVYYQLKTEMSQIRRTQRRSVRNQELKHKKELQNKANGNEGSSSTLNGSSCAQPSTQSSGLSMIEDNNTMYMSTPTCFSMPTIDSSSNPLINSTAAGTTTTAPPPLLLDTRTANHLYNTPSSPPV